MLAIAVDEETDARDTPYMVSALTTNTGRSITASSSDLFAGIGSQFNDVLVPSTMPRHEGGEQPSNFRLDV